MIIDKQNTFGIDQAVTVSAASTDYIDLGAARDIGLSYPLQVMVNVKETVTADGAATVSVALQCDDNTSFSTPRTVIASDAIPKATLAAGHQFFLPIPIGLDERYFRVYYTVGTGPLTAGKFSAYVVEGVQKNIHYPDAL